MSTLLNPQPLPARTLWAISLPALALLLAGALVVRLTHNAPFFQGMDNAWYQLMLSSRTPWLTSVNRVLDFLGNDGMVIYAVLLFLVLLLRHRRLAFFTAGANLGALLVTQLIKFLVARPRPLDRLVNVDSGSYPSGHVSATVAAMVTTAVVLGKLWMWISGAILSVAMMYSRTYLGAHWISDTIAGALLGIGVTLLLWAAMQDKCLRRYASVS
ncbi:phosphatase PAP2 family protein [Arthrobacter sp. GMC3]|uniref:phosphatase PAP2 family protein n=1 Tax=Arthrobacter sp. GMC3 TaxID=2058894 RepID=UPI000CE4CC30|nr:phosphatase PAP2 family protein [Arthrobacter sp. GMC3]